MRRSVIWAKRAAHAFLIAGLAMLAWQASIFSLAVVGAQSDPVGAERLAPGNALVLASLAQSQVAENPSAAGQTARRALRRDPTSAKAAGILSIALTQGDDLANAIKLIAYSQVISRRDLMTQFLAIQMAVQQGDVQNALHHYDIALRVGETAPTLLFPVLAAAIERRAIRLQLSRMLRADVQWKGSFLDYLSAHTTNVETASQLMLDTYALGGTVGRGPVNILIQRLLEANDVDRAWALYASANPSAARSTLRNGRFIALVDPPTLFDWQLEDHGDAHADILADRRGGQMIVRAPDSMGGPVARQRLVLARGSYLLTFYARVTQGSTFGTSTFDLLCVPSGDRIASIPLATDHQTFSRRQARFVVPEGCASQTLALTLDSSASETSIDGAVAGIAITSATLH